MTYLRTVAGAPGAGWAKFKAAPASVPLEGLVGWHVVEDVIVDPANGRAARLPGTIGQPLVVDGSGNAPTVVTVGGRKLLQTAVADSGGKGSRMWNPPENPGSVWSDLAKGAFTVLFPFKPTASSTTLKGLINVFGLYLREYTNASAVRRMVVRTFENNIADVPYDHSAMSVVGLSFDTTTKATKLYRNGPLVDSRTANAAVSMVDTVGVYGANGNPNTPSDEQFGDLMRYNRVLTDAEVAQVSAFLMARFGIA